MKIKKHFQYNQQGNMPGKFIKRGLIMMIILLGSIGVAGCFKNETVVVNQKSEEEIIKEKLEQRTPKKPLKIGLITDAHFYGKKIADKWEMNWRSRDAMLRFINKMNNEFNPDVVVENGDLVDGKDHNSLEDWKIADEMMKKLKAPYYHVIGNHEMRSFDKATWLELTGYEKPYYYHDVKGYRIIILDGNHFPGGKDTSPEKEYYPGVLGQEQWQWLEKVLKEAVTQDKDPIIFIHQPPIKTDAKPNWELFPKGEELHKLFNKYKVRAVFSGHIERLCDIKDRDTEYFVLQGFWKANSGLKKEYRFKDAGNFYYITINPEGVEVKGEHRVFIQKNKINKRVGSSERISHWDNFVLNPEEYNCQDRGKLSESNTSGLEGDKKKKAEDKTDNNNDKANE